MTEKLEVQLIDGQNIIHEGDQIYFYNSEDGLMCVRKNTNDGTNDVLIAAYNPSFVLCVRDATND